LVWHFGKYLIFEAFLKQNVGYDPTIELHSHMLVACIATLTIVCTLLATNIGTIFESNQRMIIATTIK
jgi:hypothetical protein